ncbi:hypothetical protein STEG23_031228 [Scotinomys teguina]
MSRKASEDVEYTLRSLSSLMGERRRRQPEPGAPGGERSLLAAESATSLQGAELERAARRQFQRDETPAFVYAAAAFSALGGFLFGYDTGVVSGAMLLLRRQMRLGAMWQELLVSGAVGAAAVAALAGGALNGALGRRSAILLASALCTVGSAVLAAAANKETLLAGRLVVGLGIGLLSFFPTFLSLGRSLGPEILCRVGDHRGGAVGRELLFSLEPGIGSLYGMGVGDWSFTSDNDFLSSCLQNSLNSSGIVCRTFP